MAEEITVEQAKAIALISQYEADINSYNIQKSRCNVFQAKRKKEIDAAIKQLENRIAGLKILHHIK